MRPLLALALLPLLGAVGRSDSAAPAANPFHLDAEGRFMLDPLRLEALRPAALLGVLDLPVDAIVADVGAGPGFLSLPLAAAIPRGRLIATDVRADYLAVIRERAALAGLANVETQLVAPGDPGLAPASVDLAILCQVDHALGDRAAYLHALAPALRRGGRIALVNFRRYRQADLTAAHDAGLRLLGEWDPSPPFFLLLLAPRAIPSEKGS